MNKDALWKWILLIGITSWSLALVYPLQDVKNAEGNLVQKGKIKLGLDLQGGASFTVQVDREKVQEVTLQDHPDLGPLELSRKVDQEVETAKEVALEVIRNRVDGKGIGEPEIYPQTDTDNIIVRLPGIDSENIQDAEKDIKRAAFLEFRLVHSESDAWVADLMASGMAPRGYKLPANPNAGYYIRDLSVEDKDANANNLGSFGYHGNAELKLQKGLLRDGSTTYTPVYIEIRPQLSGSAVQDAAVDYDMNNLPYIKLSFNQAGSKRFGQVTAQYAPRGENNGDSDVGRRLAIVMDGTLYSSPTIRTAIYGDASIEGAFSAEEAAQLANALRAGSLKAPLKIIQKSEVDPSLGKDSIESGIRAIILGGIAVLVFMALYYLLAGVIANISLLLVMVLLPFGMWLASNIFGLFASEGGAQTGLPVLTLPGIAGIVLTIGMAVDANVLIFERIREELRVGKSVLHSIASGYSKAFSTILDANVTTLLTAAILFWQGSGPIRGFAVTLSAGILVSMLMVLVFTRLFLESTASAAKLKSMKMFSLVKPNTKIDFVSKRKMAAALSIILIVATWAVFAGKGQDNLGIDFTGGTSYLFNFEQNPEVETVRSTLEQAGIDESTIQYQQSLGAGEAASKRLEIKVGFEEGQTALTAMESAFAKNGIQEAGEEKIGSQIGKELTRKGITAIVVAMIGIIIYISIRFEFAFAVGAIVALLHDVLITVGLYCLFGRQLSLPIIAALLTIVGYSVNDTIVVFDRIREDIKLMKGKASYSEIANLSINQTLSRTLLTSLTTLLTIIMLVLFGGGAINDFALALLIGVIVGTYSSIFIATPVVLLWHKEKKV